MYEYQTGEEVQVCDSKLWQIGVYIKANQNGTLRIKIGRKETKDFPVWAVKPNLKEIFEETKK